MIPQTPENKRICPEETQKPKPIKKEPVIRKHHSGKKDSTVNIKKKVKLYSDEESLDLFNQIEAKKNKRLDIDENIEVQDKNGSTNEAATHHPDNYKNVDATRYVETSRHTEVSMHPEIHNIHQSQKNNEINLNKSQDRIPSATQIQPYSDPREGQKSNNSFEKQDYDAIESSRGAESGNKNNLIGFCQNPNYVEAQSRLSQNESTKPVSHEESKNNNSKNIVVHLKGLSEDMKVLKLIL
jgi:hypothetical protein